MVEGNLCEGNEHGVASAAPLSIDAIAVDSMEKECGGDGDDEKDDRSIKMMIDKKRKGVDCWTWVAHYIAV